MNYLKDYKEKYVEVLRIREQVKCLDFYNKSSTEELEAINAFNLAREKFFECVCMLNGYPYLSIVDTERK